MNDMLKKPVVIRVNGELWGTWIVYVTLKFKQSRKISETTVKALQEYMKKYDNVPLPATHEHAGPVKTTTIIMPNDVSNALQNFIRKKYPFLSPVHLRVKKFIVEEALQEALKRAL